MHTKYKQKGLCEGPLGFPVKEAIARELEKRLKLAEKEGLEYKRAFVPRQPSELVEGERADISVITDQSVDRDQEVVLAYGADLSQFKANPVITWGHDYSQPPVGRAQWVKFEPNKPTATAIKAKIEYAPEGANPTADVAWNLVKAGFLKGKSIGFLPEEIGPPTQKEIDQRPELGKVKHIIRKWSLFEVAVATVPANGNALVENVAKGKLMVSEAVLKSLGLELPDEDTLIFAGDCWDWAPAPAKEVALPMPKYSRSWEDTKKKVIYSITSADELLAKLSGKA